MVSHIKRNGNAFVLDTGSPHYVEFRSDVDTLDIMHDARKIRYNDEYKEKGINVNFINRVDDTLVVRTYERGVEAETYSCGTGVTAAALVASESMSTAGHDQEIDIITKGGKLKVRFTKTSIGFENIWLIGAAQKVYEGYIDL